MTIEVALLISILSVAFSIYFGLKNSKRTDSKDIEERVKESARMNVMLETISKTMQEIKAEIVSMRADNQTQENRLAKLEESLKNAYARIKTLEERIYKEDGQHGL